mmetsp:Transcript_44309/g.42997  ORF Transcript_44309/g.42997 Transcript_44309/m.42997 type:complete len:152 (+) Transcript_44309:808-1263(+)
MEHLKSLLSSPQRSQLTLFEINRLNLGDLDNTYKVEEDIQRTMLLGMFLLAKIMVVKLLLKTANNGFGVSLSLVQKRNLKLFGSILYHSLHSLVVKSVKVKRKDFRSDDDVVSKGLFDKYSLRKMLSDPLLENSLEQTLVEWINRIMYLMQ